MVPSCAVSIRIVLAAALLLAGCAGERTASSGTDTGPASSGGGLLAPGFHELTLQHDGLTRRYLVDVPPVEASGSGPLPVVLAFHGGGGNAVQFRNSNGLREVADREGFILVHPDGTGRLRMHTWNAGFCCGPAMDDGVDDAGFVNALLDRLSGQLAVDPDRVFATGHSNGGMMAYRLAEAMPRRLAGIAPVGGSRLAPPEAPGESSRLPVPILHIHSVDDPRALYQGGVGPRFPLTNRRVDHPPVEEVLAEWRAVNGCTGPADSLASRSAPGPTGEGGPHTATLLGWGPCASGAPVLHWRLEGPGHGWPGDSARPIRQEIIGPPTSVIAAAEEVWAFFEGLR